MLLDKIEQESIHWQVALACNLLHNSTVCEIIQVVMILTNIEESINLQTPRLVYLKI